MQDGRAAAVVIRRIDGYRPYDNKRLRRRCTGSGRYSITPARSRPSIHFFPLFSVFLRTARVVMDHLNHVPALVEAPYPGDFV
jgi:hypothetical protein